MLPGRGLASQKSLPMKTVFSDFDDFDANDKKLYKQIQKDFGSGEKNNYNKYRTWLTGMYKGHTMPKRVKEMYDRLGPKITLAKAFNLNKTPLVDILKNIRSAKAKKLSRALTVYKRLQKKHKNDEIAQVIEAIEEKSKVAGRSFSSKIKRLR